MYLSKLKIVFSLIANCICLNCKMYQFKSCMHASYSASKWRRCEDYRGGFSAFIKVDMQLLSKDLLLQITCLPHPHTNKYNYKYKVMKIRVSQLNPLSYTLDFMPCHGLQSVCMLLKVTSFGVLDSVTNKCQCHKILHEDQVPQEK